MKTRTHSCFCKAIASLQPPTRGCISTAKFSQYSILPEDCRASPFDACVCPTEYRAHVVILKQRRFHTRRKYSGSPRERSSWLCQEAHRGLQTWKFEY